MRSGRVADNVDETWLDINRALEHGYRGLPGGSSISRLLFAAPGRKPGQQKRPLSIGQVLAWADEHRKRTGRWPSSCSGRVAPGVDETWGRIESAMYYGHRGLPKGGSLARLLAQRRGGETASDARRSQEGPPARPSSRKKEGKYAEREMSGPAHSPQMRQAPVLSPEFRGGAVHQRSPGVPLFFASRASAARNGATPAAPPAQSHRTQRVRRTTLATEGFKPASPSANAGAAPLECPRAQPYVPCRNRTRPPTKAEGGPRKGEGDGRKPRRKHRFDTDTTAKHGRNESHEPNKRNKLPLVRVSSVFDLWPPPAPGP